MSTPDPFHDGERSVQERAGERERGLQSGVLVGHVIPDRAIPFLAQRRMLAMGSADAQGALWASLLFGARGFVRSSDGRSVVIDRTNTSVNHEDPLWGGLRAGVNVGLLAIDLESRRRLRINGLVSELDEQRIEVSVAEVYPNCLKYIQSRHVHADAQPRVVHLEPSASGSALDEVRVRRVERADTLFVASRHPLRGADVSHRGGAPGFVRVVDANRLRIPDYRGNGMFNTLGNFETDERAGLVFLDFERGRLLQMTGTASLAFDLEEDPRQPTGGTGRYWDFQLARWLDLSVPTPLVWEFLDFSPYNPPGLP